MINTQRCPEAAKTVFCVHRKCLADGRTNRNSHENCRYSKRYVKRREGHYAVHCISSAVRRSYQTLSLNY